MQLKAQSSACKRDGRRLFGAAWLGLLCGLLLGPRTARAYSSFGDYVRSVEDGGGGGKLFTGTPADGYTCDVCHRGAQGAELNVVGLPEDGYVPGMTYEIGFQWPVTAPRVALMAEFTDTQGAPAGLPALAPYMTWTQAEKCAQNNFPAADICRAGAQPGCCRDIDPTRDACSFPGERSVLWMLECGARAARVVWTAPPQGGDVWFSATIVTSNAKNDTLGDGVTLLRRRLYPVGASTLRTEAVGSCQIIQGRNSASPRSRGLAIGIPITVGLLGWAVRRRSRARAARSALAN